MARYTSDAKQDRAYSQPEDARKDYRVNPEWAQQSSATLADASGQGDGATYYYFDMSSYRYCAIQIESDDGVAGTNTFSLEATVQDDGTAQASCTYQDVSIAYTGSATHTGNSMWIIDKPTPFKYVRILVSRTGDAGNTDGAWTIYLKKSW